MPIVRLKKNREKKAEERENMRGDTRQVTGQRKVRGVMSCRVKYSGTTIQKGQRSNRAQSGPELV